MRYPADHGPDGYAADDRGEAVGSGTPVRLRAGPPIGTPPATGISGPARAVSRVQHPCKSPDHGADATWEQHDRQPPLSGLRSTCSVNTVPGVRATVRSRTCSATDEGGAPAVRRRLQTTREAGARDGHRLLDLRRRSTRRRSMAGRSRDPRSTGRGDRPARPRPPLMQRCPRQRSASARSARSRLPAAPQTRGGATPTPTPPPDRLTPATGPRHDQPQHDTARRSTWNTTGPHEGDQPHPR